MRFVWSAWLDRGSRSASVESDQPDEPRSGGSGSRFRTNERLLGTPTRSWPARPSCGSLGRGTFSEPLSRRRFVTAGLVGTAAVVGVPRAYGASTVSVWGLDPDGGREGCGCSACHACRAHAWNKMFASAADADAGRAHSRCRCVVTQLASVEPYVYEALFVHGGRRASVDRRWQWVQAALAAAPPVARPVAAPVSPPGSRRPGAETPVPADTTSAPGCANPRDVRVLLDAAAGARLRSAWIRRLAPERRVLFVQLEAPLPVETTIRLTRRGRPLGRRHLPTVSGRQTIRIPLGPGVEGGPALLRVGFRDRNGHRRHATRTLSVPAKRARRR